MQRVTSSVKFFTITTPEKGDGRFSSPSSSDDEGRGRPQAKQHANPVDKGGGRPPQKPQNTRDDNETPPKMADKSTTKEPPPSKVNEAEVIHIPALPTVPQFRSWKLTIRDAIAAASGKPDLGFAWIRKTESNNCRRPPR